MWVVLRKVLITKHRQQDAAWLQMTTTTAMTDDDIRRQQQDGNLATVGTCTLFAH